MRKKTIAGITFFTFTSPFLTACAVLWCDAMWCDVMWCVICTVRVLLWCLAVLCCVVLWFALLHCVYHHLKELLNVCVWCVRVCTCEREGVSDNVTTWKSFWMLGMVCVYGGGGEVHVWVCVHVCACVTTWKSFWMLGMVCVCVCEREREREKEIVCHHLNEIFDIGHGGHVHVFDVIGEAVDESECLG